MKVAITEELIKRHSNLAPLKRQIIDASEAIIETYKEEGKVLVCGNGGSSADSDHIVGELMKGFEKKRPLNNFLQRKLGELSGERGRNIAEKLQQGLPAISLSSHSALITAIINDIDSEMIYAQQVAGFGKKGDCLIGISSSGNSLNVVNALITAKALDMVTIGLTGADGGKMKEYCDILINMPESRTHLVQELQLPVYHAICLIVEDYFF